MSVNRYPPLTAAQIDHFLHRGHVVIHDCFTREFAESWTSQAFVRLGYDPDDPGTWAQEIIHMPASQRVPMQEVSPKAWQAACELLGGEERVAPCTWGNGMIVNFRKGADQPWQPPSAAVPGWHKDGDFFRHFLDSPEQGLLTIVIWKDIEPKGGGTFVACDSVAPVARALAAHPEGVLPGGPPEAPFRSLIDQCREFIELTGKVGDVVLIHPYVLHASSQNHSGKARFITNPPISLKEPMQFDRPNPADFSPVERAILRGLGVERLPFHPTAPRERIVSEGMKRKQKLLEEEQARLAAASAAG
jgi:hypothetical protein